MPAARVTGRRTEPQRFEATVSDGLAAARELFARYGYADTSLDAIAAGAGVSMGALYQHFAGQRELFRAVFEQEGHWLDLVRAVDRLRP